MRILHSYADAQSIMDKDAKLLEDLAYDQRACLHLYEWKNPSITYGHFIKIEKMLQLEELKNHKIDLAKRPTGGGVIFHLYDYAFSFLLPSKSPFFSDRPIENYRFVHEILTKALSDIFPKKASYLLQNDPIDSTTAANFCMAKPTIYDLMMDEKKIAGAAQRKKNHGYLHQGTISITRPDPLLLKKILVDSEEVEAKMQNNGFYLLDQNSSLEEILIIKEKIKKQLITSFSEVFSKE